MALVTLAFPFSRVRNLCPVPNFDRYGALVFVDECHATGFFGKTGRGTDEYCGVRGRVHVSFVLSSRCVGCNGMDAVAQRGVVRDGGCPATQDGGGDVVG